MTNDLPGHDDAWPVAALDPIARLKVLSAGLPGTIVAERTLDAPFDRVWGFIEDLPRSVPTFDRTVARVEVAHRDGTRLRLRTRSTWRAGFAPIGFDVDLEEGWCWMVSRPRLYVVGMAAVPHGTSTRWGQLEGLVTRGRLLDPVLRATRPRHRRHVEHDIDGIARAVGALSD